MNLRQLPLILALAAFALAGCGDSDSSPSGDEAAVLEAVEQSNVTFARGDYAATCSHYTDRLTREMVAAAGAKGCEDLWEQTAAGMRASLTDAQFDAATGYHATSAKVDGDRATATYPDPPAAIADTPGIAGAGRTVELRREGGRWRIDALPGAAAPPA